MLAFGGMAFSLTELFLAILLCINGVAVLNEERFLKKCMCVQDNAVDAFFLLLILDLLSACCRILGNVYVCVRL